MSPLVSDLVLYQTIYHYFLHRFHGRETSQVGGRILERPGAKDPDPPRSVQIPMSSGNGPTHAKVESEWQNRLRRPEN